MVLIRGGITVKPHVQRCADAVVAEFGESLSPGTYNGHSPPEGPTQALDLFTEDSWTGYAYQEEISNWLIENQRRFGIRYVIRHNPYGLDWIWNIERADEGWRAMATNDHRGHVHVTFYASAEVEPAPTPVPTTGDESMKVRYIWGPSPLEQTDWVFDGPGRIHATGMTADVLRGCDLNKIPELGHVDNATHNWYGSVASNWK